MIPFAPDEKSEKEALPYLHALVSWCPICESYEIPYQKGADCPGAPHDDTNQRKGLKRWMFICRIPDHCEEMGFFLKADLEEHWQEYRNSFAGWRSEVENVRE